MAVADPMPTAKATTASAATPLALIQERQAWAKAESMSETLLSRPIGVKPGGPGCSSIDVNRRSRRSLSAVRKLLAGIAIGVGAAALVLLVAWPGWLETAELKTYDWRMRTLAKIRIARGQSLVHPDIVLVEITDASIRDLSELVGRWPWPRALQAMLVDYISSGKPKVDRARPYVSRAGARLQV